MSLSVDVMKRPVQVLEEAYEQRQKIELKKETIQITTSHSDEEDDNKSSDSGTECLITYWDKRKPLLEEPLELELKDLAEHL